MASIGAGSVDICGTCGFDAGVQNSMLSMSTDHAELSCGGRVLARQDKGQERTRGGTVEDCLPTRVENGVLSCDM